MKERVQRETERAQREETERESTQKAGKVQRVETESER